MQVHPTTGGAYADSPTAATPPDIWVVRKMKAIYSDVVYRSVLVPFMSVLVFYGIPLCDKNDNTSFVCQLPIFFVTAQFGAFAGLVTYVSFDMALEIYGGAERLGFLSGALGAILGLVLLRVMELEDTVVLWWLESSLAMGAASLVAVYKLPQDRRTSSSYKHVFRVISLYYLVLQVYCITGVVFGYYATRASEALQTLYFVLWWLFRTLYKIALPRMSSILGNPRGWEPYLPRALFFADVYYELSVFMVLRMVPNYILAFCSHLLLTALSLFLPLYIGNPSEQTKGRRAIAMFVLPQTRSIVFLVALALFLVGRYGPNQDYTPAVSKSSVSDESMIEIMLNQLVYTLMGWAMLPVARSRMKRRWGIDLWEYGATVHELSCWPAASFSAMLFAVMNHKQFYIVTLLMPPGEGDGSGGDVVPESG